MWMMTFVTVAIMAAVQDSQEPCDSKGVGDSVIIPLGISILKPDYDLTWKKDFIVIFDKKSTTIRKGKQDDVMANGSLKLTEVQLSSAGQYDAEVFNADGLFVTKTTRRLCVIEKVPQVSLHYSCGENVTLTCHPEHRVEHGTFTWKKNNQKVSDADKETLVMSWTSTQGAMFSCMLRNKVSEAMSKSLPVDCKKPSSNISTTAPMSHNPSSGFQNKDVPARTSGKDVLLPQLTQVLLFNMFTHVLTPCL